MGRFRPPVTWSVLVLSQMLLILAAASSGASSGPGLIISKSMAQCRASCISTLAPTRTPGDESCKRSQFCSTCWTTCAQLAVHYPIWSFKCHQADSCDRGCQTACNFFTKANATPPPPPSSPSHPSHHPSVYIPPIPPTHPTPPAKLSMEFDERGAAKWTLVWSAQEFSRSTKPYEDINVDSLFKSAAVTQKQKSDQDDGLNNCRVCGACGVVFGVFYKKMHHHPWTLYRQTQASFMDLESIEIGSQLQLIAVANCGTVSVIITPYQPVLSKSPERSNKTDSKTSYSRADLDMHERRYETLAQHYASKRVKVNYDETTAAPPVPQHDREANAIAGSAMGSSELMEVPHKSSTWTLHFNASVNMTDLIYTKIWWNPSDITAAALKMKGSNESHNKVRKSNEKSASEASMDYLVTWEDQSGTIKGHSMTRNPYISFDLWPHTVYKIQAQVVMGPVIDSSVSNPLVIDAGKLYKELSKNLKQKQVQNLRTDDTNYPELNNDSFSDKKPDVAESEVVNQNRTQISSHESNSFDDKNSEENQQSTESKKFPLSDSYVYAEVETDYAPLFVKTAPVEPAESVPSVHSNEKFGQSYNIVPKSEVITPITDSNRSDERKVEPSLDRDVSKEEEDNNKLFYESEGIKPNSEELSLLGRNSQSEEVPLGADSHIGTQVEDLNIVLSGEIITGIVAAFILVLVIIVALAFYMRYYIRRVTKKKGSFRADGYDTTSSASSKDTEKSDDCNNALGGKTTKPQNKNQWFPFRHANKVEIYSKADDVTNTYGFVSKDINRTHAVNLDRLETSRCANVEFPTQSSDCLMPGTKYQPNNTSSHSDNTSTTVISDSNTAGVYNSDSSDCSSNIRYTHSPHEQRRHIRESSSGFGEQEVLSSAYPHQDEYVEIPDRMNISSRPMCTLPDLTNTSEQNARHGGYQQPGPYVPYALEENPQRAPRSLPYGVNDSMASHSRMHPSEALENVAHHSRSHSLSSCHNDGFAPQNHYPNMSTPVHMAPSSIPMPSACIPAMYLPSQSCQTPNSCVVSACPTPTNYLPQSTNCAPVSANNYMPSSSACPTPTHLQASSHPNSLQYMPPQTNSNVPCSDQPRIPPQTRGPQTFYPHSRVPEPLPRQSVPQAPNSKPAVPKKPVHLPHNLRDRRAFQPVPQQRTRDC